MIAMACNVSVKETSLMAGNFHRKEDSLNPSLRNRWHHGLSIHAATTTLRTYM